MTKEMDILLKLEEAGMLFFSIFLFSQLNFVWWVFPVCILLPDLSMLGYLINPKIGAYTYNFAHHKMIAIVLYIIGFGINAPALLLAGIILFGHSSMDRMLGYGLKYTDSFSHTHLGTIGKK